MQAVASLAVRLDRQDCSVGLVTNGMVAGGGGTTVAVRRNPQQLTALLEVLARLQMVSKESLLDILLGRYSLFPRVSCMHFSFQEDKATVATEHYLFQRNTPVVFFVSRHSAASEKEGPKLRSRLHSLDELLVKKPGDPL